MSTDPNEDDEVPFPLAVKIAGWIWIFIGGFDGLLIALSLLPMQGVDVSRVYFTYFFAFLFAIMGVAGFETIRGLPRDVRPYGIGSIALALTFLPLFVLLNIFLLVLLKPMIRFPGMLNGAWIADGMLAIQTLLLMIAGVLALRGRQQYLDWREANGLPVGVRNVKQPDPENES